MSGRKLLAAALCVGLVGLVAVYVFSGGRRAEKDQEEQTAVSNTVEVRADESPFACNMSALNREERERHLKVLKQVREGMLEMTELPDGYAFRFAADTANILLVSEFVARERLCCPFFTFESVAEREGGPLWLRLRGRAGVKEFIRIEFGLK